MGGPGTTRPFSGPMGHLCPRGARSPGRTSGPAGVAPCPAYTSHSREQRFTGRVPPRRLSSRGRRNQMRCWGAGTAGPGRREAAAAGETRGEAVAGQPGGQGCASAPSPPPHGHGPVASTEPGTPSTQVGLPGAKTVPDTQLALASCELVTPSPPPGTRPVCRLPSKGAVSA